MNNLYLMYLIKEEDLFLGFLSSDVSSARASGEPVTGANTEQKVLWADGVVLRHMKLVRKGFHILIE